jgi:hypothetical protein
MATPPLLESVRERDARLRKQQAEQQVIFDSVPALIWYKDTANRIVRIKSRRRGIHGPAGRGA